MKRTATILAVLAAGGAAQAAGLSSYREIKDWIAACDNGWSCEAQAVPEDTASMPEDASFGFSRDPGPEGPVRVDLQWGAAAAPPSMRLDGKPLPAFSWSRPDQDGVRLLEGPAALELLRSLRNGQVLVIGAGAESYKVSLAGLSAVMLFMDEAQHRVGGQTALARQGSAPGSAMPQAPAPPRLHAAPIAPPVAHPEALVAAVRSSQANVLSEEGCEDDAKAEDGAEPLTRTEALVTVTCIVGAYQASSLVFRVPRDAPAKARLVELPLPPGEPADAPERHGFLTSASYDPKTASLGEWAKGRGLGDCGVAAGWVFDGQAFQLSDYSIKNRCGGQAGALLRVWRSASD